jgi:cytidylate kinase
MNRFSSSGHLGEALARASRHWQARLIAEATAPTPRPPAPSPFTIAFSREAGTNGTAVARQVGAALGWPVYDYELLQRIAEEMGLHASLLESVDEKRVGWLRECVDACLSLPAVSESTYSRRLAETLLSLAAHGACVIVGRGAAQVLPVETTVRVRLVGSLPDRIAAVQEKLHVGREEAARHVDARDRDRTRFVKDHFLKDPTDPSQYDLVLNSPRLSVQGSAGVILEGLRCLQARVIARGLPPSPAEGQRTGA